ncbi:MAG: hypothetical protein C6I00_05835 [Nitratiruptor sp.]|nr:hypothetical protein [Nitratiruptor sp.]NPA83619.1 hypothetical protein [Campylobacterota bacterium]
MVKNIKEKIVALAMKQLFNRHIQEFGEILYLGLDSENKEIEMEVMLRGEQEPLIVRVRGYEIVEEDGNYYLIANQIETSREWIDTLIANSMANRRFAISQQIAKTLKATV